jgi:hypothetical protein
MHASGTVAQILLGANITPTSAEVMITSEVADIIKAKQIAKITTFLRIKLLVGMTQFLLPVFTHFYLQIGLKKIATNDTHNRHFEPSMCRLHIATVFPANIKQC